MKVVGRVATQKIDQFMTQDMLDKNSRKELSQQLLEIEKVIFETNQRLMQEKVPALDSDSFIRFSHLVAETRANYIRMALEVSKLAHQPEAAVVDQLRRQRITYEELLSAFEAMQRVLERGYVKLKKLS
ncbi:MAG: hypothetical protein HY058_14090 [Proteobacteria bacterium]|nr:hypothetical protein [Pseudomonadota bacterium]